MCSRIRTFFIGLFFIGLVLFPYSYSGKTSGIGPSLEMVYQSRSPQNLFEKYVFSLYSELNENEIEYKIFRYAMQGMLTMKQEEKLKRDTILTLIDFSQSANNKRCFVIDIKNKKLLYKTLIAHGRNSGVVYPSKFSNRSGSNQSSIGFFIANETYKGRRGYSLKLDGLEKTNSKVRPRGVVIHGAEYVNERYIKYGGRIGRSNGCPAVPININSEFINQIKNKSCLFIYYPDKKYLSSSYYLNSDLYLKEFDYNNSIAR